MENYLNHKYIVVITAACKVSTTCFQFKFIFYNWHMTETKCYLLFKIKLVFVKINQKIRNWVL